MSAHWALSCFLLRFFSVANIVGATALRSAEGRWDEQDQVGGIGPGPVWMLVLERHTALHLVTYIFFLPNTSTPKHVYVYRVQSGRVVNMARRRGRSGPWPACARLFTRRRRRSDGHSAAVLAWARHHSRRATWRRRPPGRAAPGRRHGGRRRRQRGVVGEGRERQRAPRGSAGQGGHGGEAAAAAAQRFTASERETADARGDDVRPARKRVGARGSDGPAWRAAELAFQNRTRPRHG